MNKKFLLLIGALLMLAALPKEEPDAILPDSIEGCWDEVSDPGYTWEFKKGHLKLWRFDRPNATHRYEIDLSRSPQVIRFSDRTYGIFVITGDTMKLCVVRNHVPLPTSFNRKKGEIWLYLFKRKQN